MCDSESYSDILAGLCLPIATVPAKLSPTDISGSMDRLRGLAVTINPGEPFRYQFLNVRFDAM